MLLPTFRWVDRRHLPCCHLKPVISNYAANEMVEQVLTRGRNLGFHFLNNVPTRTMRLEYIMQYYILQ